MVVDRINDVMKPRVLLEMLDVFDATGREVVDYPDFVAPADVCIRKM